MAQFALWDNAYILNGHQAKDNQRVPLLLFLTIKVTVMTEEQLKQMVQYHIELTYDPYKTHNNNMHVCEYLSWYYK